MQVPEEPGYYGASPVYTTPLPDCPDPDFSVPSPNRDSEYAHVGSLDGSSMQDPDLPRANAKRYGSYVVRAPPSSGSVSTLAATKPTASLHQLGQRLPSRPGGDNKRFAILDPLEEESRQRTMSQQNRLSRIVTPTKAKSRPLPTSPRSGGNPSQRRSLSRFTKELERYCVAASANGTVPLPLSTPTVSGSPTTLDTVTELLPYHKQFKAAGLAVTSREQMPGIPESAHSQMPRTRAERVRKANTAVVQVDGSTVTPSEQETITQETAAPAVTNEEDGEPSNSQSAAKGPTSEARSVTKSLLPWFRKREPAAASRTHSDRKFSKDHIHPSLATPAGPLLTPSGRLELIDSYFDTPKTSKRQDEQPTTHKTLLSSPVSSNKSSQFDKPLPKQPPMKRRPIPLRSERRHMENTAEWPTAGVLIHDNSPRQNEDKIAGVFDDDQTDPANDSNSIHSWTTVEDGVPDKPERSPPAPPKETIDTTSVLAEEKPNRPPKDVPGKDIGSSASRRHHQGHSLCNKWYKATGLRRRSLSKPLPLPTPIREESETPPEESEKPCSGSRPKLGLDKPVPQLPITFPFPVESSSSFEKALDAVISKLDAMEERRRYERNMDLEVARQALAKPESSEKSASREASSKPRSAPSSEPTASAAAPASEEAVEYSDNDIDDRDILLGLKMAICAACDEDLDAWIREKTGLRLRRFLADLKAFESVSRDRKPSPPQPMSRRIRRNGRENRRLQAEQERRRRNSKHPWANCFGADGQVSLPALNREP